MLVAQIVSELGLREPAENRRLVTVGSIMAKTKPGDVIWGTGVNGKNMDTGAAPHLDVRAVRGPRTREMLMSVGSLVPPVYGDPALLWSRYWPREYYLSSSPSVHLRPLTIVPNYNDAGTMDGPEVVSPLGVPHDVIRQIAASEFVCGSSLHAIVLAESFGIPARLVRSKVEPPLKYDDYYMGTGRETYSVAECVEEAVAMGGERPPSFDIEALRSSFPADLYINSPQAR